MKVHRNEGVAIHIGPEPCAGIREGVGEASVGERAGQPLSHERIAIRVPTLFKKRKATRGARYRECLGRPCVVGEPGMHVRSLRGNREISGLAAWQLQAVRIGKARSRSR